MFNCAFLFPTQTLCSDSVFAIREAGVQNMKSLAKEFGDKWALETIIPPVLELASANNYLHRMSLLSCIAVSVFPVGWHRRLLIC